VPVEQTIPPTLIEVRGTALKPVSNGHLGVEITVTPGASGWPPDQELNQLLLELFHQVGFLGWVGTVNKRFISEETLSPDLPPENPTEVFPAVEDEPTP
jgi:hypothetical protein